MNLPGVVGFQGYPVVGFLLLLYLGWLRYETRLDQLRHVPAKLRELLLAHPRVTLEQPGQSTIRLAVMMTAFLTVGGRQYTTSKLS